MPAELGARVVVITGASSGIGEATAYAFARKGAKLVLAARNAAALHQVARRCRELGAEALVVPTDIGDAEAVRDLAKSARSFGSIDIWVSNAGVGAVGAFHETPIALHERVIRTNLLGHMNDAHAALPVFLEQGRGTFINIISAGGFAAIPYAAAYSASKFGLRGFSEALRGELAGHRDIHVCDIYPDFIDTPGIRHGANYIGRRLTAPPPLTDPRYVADVIVRTARRPRPTTTIGPTAMPLRLFHALAPNLTARVAASILKTYFRRAEPVAQSSGNLFRPPARPGGVDGGMRKHPELTLRSLALPMLGGVVLASVLAAEIARRQTRR
jgi:short-subunit dehydrogenase